MRGMWHMETRRARRRKATRLPRTVGSRRGTPGGAGAVKWGSIAARATVMLACPAEPCRQRAREHTARTKAGLLRAFRRVKGPTGGPRGVGHLNCIPGIVVAAKALIAALATAMKGPPAVQVRWPEARGGRVSVEGLAPPTPAGIPQSTRGNAGAARNGIIAAAAIATGSTKWPQRLSAVTTRRQA